MIRVTVLSHNRPAFLDRCLRSLVAQTNPDWTAHIIDICSTNPKVFDVINDWAQFDGRFTVQHLPEYIEDEAIYANPELDRVNPLGGVYVSVCDNNEYSPDCFRVVADWFDNHPEAFAAYVTHERDIFSPDGLTREGPASNSGHWNICPPIPGEVFSHDALGFLDHSQVFHRLPVLARWQTAAEAGGDPRVDGLYFNEIIRLHGPIHPIAPGTALSHEHLAWRV